VDVFRLDTKSGSKVSPCQSACPLGVEQRVYIDLLNKGMLDEAAESLRSCHPMPAITGRLCPHPCETACSRNNIDEAVNINSLEQYTGDYLLDRNVETPKRLYRAKVAVIGSGPGGLSAAYFLTRSGYEVTVFEKCEKPGGQLRTGVPNFRLSEAIIDKQISFYEKLGIRFQCGVIFGKDITKEELENNGYQAFIAATGAAKPLILRVPGSDANGITSAMAFLAEVKAGNIKTLQGRIAVIGGGSVALDAARSAIRLGASEVSIYCLEKLEKGTKDSMLALTDEIEDAINEGVKIRPSRSVSSFVTDAGNVVGIKCVECLSVRDNEGRFSPVYGDDSLAEAFAADTVVLAIGQTADPDSVPNEFEINQRGYIVADIKTTMVAPGLFAVGDAVSGPSTIVLAAASGKRAAIAVDNYLKGEDLLTGLGRAEEKFISKPNPEIITSARVNRNRLEASECTTHFQETTQPFDLYQANLESERCLTCGSLAKIVFQEDCQICHLCRLYCPTDSITITSEKAVPPIIGL
jgi:NADPH-dependent glutamate synthase beta subunit-like oxidoreductase